jgi:alpha-galactosidase/6-phospho-beta-glucosidase family protein
MPKIAIIGAGSAVFSKNIIADILWHPALSDSEKP